MCLLYGSYPWLWYFIHFFVRLIAPNYPLSSRLLLSLTLYYSLSLSLSTTPPPYYSSPSLYYLSRLVTSLPTGASLPTGTIDSCLLPLPLALSIYAAWLICCTDLT